MYSIDTGVDNAHDMHVLSLKCDTPSMRLSQKLNTVINVVLILVSPVVTVNTPHIVRVNM